MGTTTDRPHNDGIDLLRMTAMLMVVVLHILGKGGVLGAAPFPSVRAGAAWLLEAAAYCAVDCYALVSGYVGGRHRWADLAALWLRVAFYTVGITAAFALLLPGSVSGDNWLRAVCPVLFNQYWYVTAYFCLFCFLPLLEPAVRAMSRRQLGGTAAGLTVLLSLLPTVFQRDAFGTQAGYHGLWLMAVYVVGAYFGRYGFPQWLKGFRALLGYGVLTGLTWAVKVVCGSGALLQYTSPTVLGAGVCLLALFQGLHLPGWLRRTVAFAAPLSFSVYLIHAQPLVWKYLIADRFASFASHSAPGLALRVVGTALAIYVACSLLDLPRAALFRSLRVKDRLRLLEDRLPH